MHRLICGTALLCGVCTMAGCLAWSQSIGPDQRAPARFVVAATYDAASANVTTGDEFGMQGGSAQVQMRLWRRLSAAADVAGLHTGNVNGSGIGLDLITATFGPRYVWSPQHRRLSIFGQALAGDAHGRNSVFPSSTGTNSSGNSLALQLGGGIDLPLPRRFFVRAFDADWLRTQLPNATTNVQNNLRMGAGIVYAFK